jgi:hypothetical protein
MRCIPLLFLALATCGARTGPIVDPTEMLAVTCHFNCQATRIDYCNVNCGNTGPMCLAQSATPVPLTVPFQLCLPGSTTPAAAIEACRAAGGEPLQNAYLGVLGIRREWPCGLPDPSSSLPRPQWTPASATVTGLSCTPNVTMEPVTVSTVCYSR